MLNTLIMSTSDYADAELVIYINRRPHMNITALTIPTQSNNAGKLISDLHPQLKGVVDMSLQPMSGISEFNASTDVVPFTTVHEVSHDLILQLLTVDCVVFDLSGVFRVDDGAFYEEYYGFTHQHPDLLKQVVYNLAKWSADTLKEAQLIAVPDCYPTMAQLSLEPLIEANLLDLNQWPMINAISGVSGASRKATIGNNFCEANPQPYGIFNHHHQPETASHLRAKVIFIPHLDNFKRGILETITCRLKPGVGHAQIAAVYQKAHADKPLVHLYDKSVPALKDVEGLLLCDTGFTVQDDHLIVIAAEDNLLKDAMTQVVQYVNIRLGSAETQSLV